MMTTARAGPTRNASRQPRTGPTTLRNSSETSVPMIDPAQYVPLTARSTRPRYFAGIISSMAELMAAYSPPIPMPAMTRVPYRKRNHIPPAGVIAVSPLPTRYTPSVIMNRLRRPSLSDSWPKNSAPMTSPMRYQVAMSATELADSPRAALWVRSGPTFAAIVISSPSRTQATPSALTNLVWNLDHGSRSIRAGIRLRIVPVLGDCDVTIRAALLACRQAGQLPGIRLLNGVTAGRGRAVRPNGYTE